MKVIQRGKNLLQSYYNIEKVVLKYQNRKKIRTKKTEKGRRKKKIAIYSKTLLNVIFISVFFLQKIKNKYINLIIKLIPLSFN